MTKFRSGLDAATPSPPFEAGMLPDAEKEQLCLDLLVEFGATNVRDGSRGELIHSCVLPFGGHAHGDANPSASLNYLKLTYNCLGCGNSGGLLWFIGVCRGDDTHDARRWLGSRTGTGGSVQDLSALLTFFEQLYEPQRPERVPLPRMSPRVLEPWMWIHPWLTEIRHVPEAALVHFRVGWNPDLNRIVIPHWWRGELVGWQTRRLVNDGTPKYKSSPDFPKDGTIFNYDPTNERAVVVESPMSVLAHWDITPDIEATFGATVTDRQARLLTMHPEVVLHYDNDQAGWSATKRVGKVLEAYSKVFVADNPWNEDAGGLDDDEYLRTIAGAVPFALWHPRLPCSTMKKYGKGDILPEPDPQPKQAAPAWTDDDEAELQQRLLTHQTRATPRRVELFAPDEPYLVGDGPSECSSCVELERYPPVCFDVNGYYALFGVDPRCSREDLRRAYQQLNGQESTYLTAVLKTLLDPDRRRIYDRTPFGHLYIDDAIIAAEKRRLKLQISAEVLRAQRWGLDITDEIAFRELFDRGETASIFEPSERFRESFRGAGYADSADRGEQDEPPPEVRGCSATTAGGRNTTTRRRSDVGREAIVGALAGEEGMSVKRWAITATTSRGSSDESVVGSSCSSHENHVPTVALAGQAARAMDQPQHRGE
jgi:hypothetical protein